MEHYVDILPRILAFLVVEYILTSTKLATSNQLSKKRDGTKAPHPRPLSPKRVYGPGTWVTGVRGHGWRFCPRPGGVTRVVEWFSVSA